MDDLLSRLGESYQPNSAGETGLTIHLRDVVTCQAFGTCVEPTPKKNKSRRLFSVPEALYPTSKDAKKMDDGYDFIVKQ